MANQVFSIQSVFDYILTRRDGEKLIDLLEGMVFSGETKVDLSLLSSELSVLSNLIDEDLDLEKLLEEFRNAFWKLEFVNLKLAYTPTRTFLSELKRWFEKNMNGPVIIDLEVDKSIIGGAVIVARDHWRDLSIAQRYAFLLSPKRHIT